MKKDPIYQDGETVEWYTPPIVIDLVRKHFGTSGIGLDPASCEFANKLVKARRIFTKEDDGLTKEWKTKTLFMNPPYGAQLTRDFTNKLLSELDKGNITVGAILLINSNTSTIAWQNAFNQCDAVCFASPRLKFMDANGNIQENPRYSNTLFYYGRWKEKFCTNFKTLGAVSLRS